MSKQSRSRQVKRQKHVKTRSGRRTAKQQLQKEAR